MQKSFPQPEITEIRTYFFRPLLFLARYSLDFSKYLNRDLPVFQILHEESGPIFRNHLIRSFIFQTSSSFSFGISGDAFFEVAFAATFLLLLPIRRFLRLSLSLPFCEIFLLRFRLCRSFARPRQSDAFPDREFWKSHQTALFPHSCSAKDPRVPTRLLREFRFRFFSKNPSKEWTKPRGLAEKKLPNLSSLLDVLRIRNQSSSLSSSSSSTSIRIPCF